MCPINTQYSTFNSLPILLLLLFLFVLLLHTNFSFGQSQVSHPLCGGGCPNNNKSAEKCDANSVCGCCATGGAPCDKRPQHQKATNGNVCSTLYAVVAVLLLPCCCCCCINVVINSISSGNNNTTYTHLSLSEFSHPLLSELCAGHSGVAK